MKINEALFNEITYVYPSEATMINPDSDNPINDYELIQKLLMDEFPIDDSETDYEYADLIDDEMNDTMLGIIDSDTLLSQAMFRWQQAGNADNLHALKYYNHDAIKRYYFLTRDSNYDLVDADLLAGDDSGETKRAFLAYINSID